MNKTLEQAEKYIESQRSYKQDPITKENLYLKSQLKLAFLEGARYILDIHCKELYTEFMRKIERLKL